MPDFDKKLFASNEHKQHYELVSDERILAGAEVFKEYVVFHNNYVQVDFQHRESFVRLADGVVAQELACAFMGFKPVLACGATLIPIFENSFLRSETGKIYNLEKFFTLIKIYHSTLFYDFDFEKAEDQSISPFQSFEGETLKRRKLCSFLYS